MVVRDNGGNLQRRQLRGMSPLEVPAVAVPSPDLPMPPFHSTKTVNTDGSYTVYYQHGNEVRTERVPLVGFDAERQGYYQRWRNAP